MKHLRFLPLLCLLVLCLSACLEEKDALLPPTPEYANDFSYAYTVSETLPQGELRIHHVYLTPTGVSDGQTLAGTNRALKFSYLSKSTLAAGVYPYRVGPMLPNNDLTIFNLEYFDNFNFSESDNGSRLAPYEATITVDYAGEEMMIKVSTIISGTETAIANYTGIPTELDVEPRHPEMETPSAEDENKAFSGDHDFVIHKAQLFLPDAQLTGTGVCRGRIELSADPALGSGFISPQFPRILVEFKGSGLHMTDGLMRLKGQSGDYLDNFGLTITDAIVIIPTGVSEFERSYSNKGHANIYVQDNFVMMDLHVEGPDGAITKANYRGPLDLGTIHND